jgi:hypothetical protein
MELTDIAKAVFKLSRESNVISPPDQVFLNPEFNFLLTIGHFPVNDKEEYDKFISLLKEIGETEFYILENWPMDEPETDKLVIEEAGREPSDPELDEKIKALERVFGTADQLKKLRKEWISVGRPYSAKFAIGTSFKEFKNELNALIPRTDFSMYDFYVFGQNPKWGIYLCECPTINIIGCLNDLSDRFAWVFKITGNGFEELEDFIKWECNAKPELVQLLIDNYRLIK